MQAFGALGRFLIRKCLYVCCSPALDHFGGAVPRLFSSTHCPCCLLVLQPALAAADLPVTTHPAGDDGAAAAEARTSGSNDQSSGHRHDGGQGSQELHSSGSHALPEELLLLADALAPVSLPPPHTVPPGSLDNRELDKLVGTLGRNKATWRRALVLSQWLQESGHVLDDRLCTTVSSMQSWSHG